MSKISDILDSIRTLVPLLTGFSTKTELPNPYDLESNQDNLIRDAWGITVGASNESSFNVFKESRIQQQINIILTREVIKTPSDPDPMFTASKNILEDALLIRLDMLDFDQLGIELKIEKIDYLGNSGVQFVSGDKSNYMFTEVSFSVEISETI